jgi:hypothetical protein
MRPRRFPRTLPALAVAAVLTATTLATATAAHAEWTPAPGWPSLAVCAEGEVAGAEGSPGWLDVSGWVRPCADADPAMVAQARIGMAFYHTQRNVTSPNPGRTFASATDPTPVHLFFGPVDGAATSGLGILEAVCLVTRPESRIACLAVGVGAGGALWTTPIPVTDPLVAGPVLVLPSQTIDPECAACV